MGIGIERFFSKKLMPQVEDSYRIKKENAFRAVRTFDARRFIMYALASSYILSAASIKCIYGPLSFVEQFKEQIIRNGRIFNSDAEAYYKKDISALELESNARRANKMSVVVYWLSNVWFLYEGNSHLFHIEMKKKEFPRWISVKMGHITENFGEIHYQICSSLCVSSFHQINSINNM